MNEYERASLLLRSLSHPVRLQIVEALARNGEACVCHLEWTLGQRQPQVSQHLMRLKEAGLVVGRREGMNVFYSLVDRETLSILEASIKTVERQAERDGGQPVRRWQAPVRGQPCPCPKCHLDMALAISQAT